MLPSGLSSDIRDLNEIIKSIRLAMNRMKEGDNEAASASLRFAKGLVNVSDFLEPHAKAIMTSVFAEFHHIIDPLTTDSDVLFDNFIRSMEFIYGREHVVLSDCYTMLSAFFANAARIPEAIEYGGKALLNRIGSVGLMHRATADSHYNLGLLYRMNGQLVKSKKELRICRGILSTLFGEESLAVAKVDLSLGQTERLLIAYDRAYLHFYLCFHSRATLSGPCHQHTQRAYQLLCSIRHAYADRLLTSLELIDRVDELGWFQLEEGEGEDGDLFAVVSGLLTQVYAAKSAAPTTTKSNSTINYKAGLDSGGGSVGSLVGDCLVMRLSQLQGMVQEAVRVRVESVLGSQAAVYATEGAINNGELRQRKGNRNRGRLSRSFNSRDHIPTLTAEIVRTLFPDAEKPTVKISGTKQKVSAQDIPLLSSSQIDFYQRRMETRARNRKEEPVISPVNVEVKESIKNGFTPPTAPPPTLPPKFVSFDPPSTPPPPVSTLNGNGSYSGGIRDDAIPRPPGPSGAKSPPNSNTFTPPTKETRTGAKSTPLVDSSASRKAQPTKAKTPPAVNSSPNRQTVKPTTTKSKLRASSIYSAGDKPILPTPTELMKPDTPQKERKPNSENKPTPELKPDTKVKVKLVVPDMPVPVNRNKAFVLDNVVSKESAVAKVETSSRNSVDSFSMTKDANFDNKRGSAPTLGTGMQHTDHSLDLIRNPRNPQTAVIPHLGKRKLVIAKNSEGQKVAIRPLRAEDIVDALRVKIFAAGIFPYLLLTDVEAVEREARENIIAATSNSSGSTVPEERKNAENEEKAREEARVAAEKEKAEEEARKKAEEEEAKQEELKKSKKPIPRPPPLPTCWPPVVVDGKNVGGNDLESGGVGLPGPGMGGGGRGALLGALLGGRGGGGRGPVAFLRRKSGGNFKPSGPKLKQLHWETLASTEGTLWENTEEEAAVVSDDAFSDLAEVFAPAQKKDPSKKKPGEMPGAKGLPGVGAKSKQVAVLDGQKSQNMNIMLAKFGSRRKVSEIVQAIVNLDTGSFTLPIVMTMLDFTPATFADTGEVAAIKTAVETHGIDKLGKAERYLHEIAKVPRVENYLKTMALLLSVEDVKKQTAAAVEIIVKAVEEVKGSKKLKVMFQSILKVGNVLNQGSKKSGATGFKISSLPKLTQTKSNAGETVLDYLVVRLGRDMPEVLELKADMPSLEEAKYISFPTLQLDISKLESGLKMLTRLKDDIKKVLDDGGNPDIGATDAIYERLCLNEKDIGETLSTLKEQIQDAIKAHEELCVFLGEDPKTSDPEALYGQILSFVSSVDSVVVRKLKRV
mmetsp:Transcript_4831/g.7348  ORF Transcript_4831/g.7348 Transcript_4831/m.7348 type:complete len:1311 (+) Transcript_4831:91-4023(+)